MKPMPQISEAESEVMKVLWELGRATSAQIVDRLVQATDWKPKTIQTLIARLTAKGAITVEDTGARAYIYLPSVSEDEFRAHANVTFLQKIYNGSVNLMLASFVREQKISKDDIEHLKKMLDEDV